MEVRLRMQFNTDAKGYGMVKDGPREEIVDVIITPARRSEAVCTRKTSKGDHNCARLAGGCRFTEMRSPCGDALFV